MNATKRVISSVLLAFSMVMQAQVPVMAAPANQVTPTITSDQADYPPGATVILTGAGWQAGETVPIFVNDDASQSWSFRSSPDPVADSAGVFVYRFQLPNWFVANYSVLAGPGSLGSGTAATTFTDLNIGTYDQCSNDLGTGYTTGDLGCRWINGNLQSNNSIYFEGDATVQRVWLTDFAPGLHTLTLQYGTTKGGKHAYDFLTTWDWSEDWITEADLCQDVTNCEIADATDTRLDIPQDPNVPDSFEPSAPGDRQFVMRGATLTSATTPAIESGSYAGDSETIITISFVVPNSGPMCASSTSCSVVLWFGAHVSAQANWGLGQGAGSISGSPYHVALYRIDGASVGQRDNQMQANVVSVVPNGTIVVVKDAVPNSAQDFSFNLNNGSTINQNFSLDDDADPTLPNSQTFSVPPGTWTVSELNIPAGWTLTNLVCVDPTSNTTVSGATATIALASSETVTCTYTDTSGGSIIVEKQTQPDGSTQQFEFNPSWSDTNFFLADGQQNPSGSLAPGVYSVAEVNVPNWTLDSTTCSDGSPVGAIDLQAGETVTCVFNNSRNTGSLVLVKALTGGPSDYTGPFTINYDCDGTAYDGSVQVNAGSSQTISGIPTGTSCTIGEALPTPPAGYSFGTPSYSPSNVVTIPDTGNRSVTVTTNNSLSLDVGSLKLYKVLDAGGSGFTSDFSVHVDCGGGNTGNFTVPANGSYTLINIPAGSICTVSEPTLPTPPAGYSWGTPSISGSPATIVKGATVEVTVNNSLTRNTGKLVLAKSLSGGPSGYTGPFTIGYTCDNGTNGSVQVNAGGSAEVTNLPTGTQCTVSETPPTAPTGYSFGTPTYSPSNIVTIPDMGDRSVTVTTNNTLTRDKGSLILAKALTGGPSGYDGPFTIEWDCGAFGNGSESVFAGSQATIPNIPTGTSCTVSEPTLPSVPGYTFGSPTFSPEDTVVIPAGNGSSATVTTNNSLSRDTGSLKITKTTSNLDGATLPAAFTGTYDCGDGYTGNWSVANDGSQTISGIPTGNTCTVTEVAPTPIPDYTWGTVTYTPASVVISTKGGTFEIVVGNSITRDRGSLKILKTLSGDGAFIGSFNVSVVCDGDGGTYNPSISFPTPGYVVINNIPAGVTCEVTEPTLPQAPDGYSWGTPEVSGSPASISKDETVVVTVANTLTRDRGSFKITKTTSNPDGAILPAAFSGTYDCGVGYTGNWSVGNNGSQTISGIPTGNTCSVEEAAPAPIFGYTWGAAIYTPASVVISTKGETFVIAVGNSITRDRGSLKILKTLSNPDGADVPASFSVNYFCGAGYVGNVSVSPVSPATISDIPTGNTCTVVEVAPSPIPNYTWGTVTYSPTSVVIEDKGGTFEITVGNSITRDRGSLTLVKKVVNDHGGTATVSAFGLNTSAGSLTFDSGVPNGSTTTYTSTKLTVVTGNYTLKENNVYGYTEGAWTCTGAAGTVVPTFNNGSVDVGKDEDVVCTIINNDDPGKIVVIKNAKPAQGNFAFTTTGSGYNNFNLTGATASAGNVNTQTLSAGTYTVKESTQLGWILTGIGGSTDPTKPYNCVVTGSGGSTGVGDLDTKTASIVLKNGDTVTCTFENTGVGATRTQGFWATHPQLAQIAWDGGSRFGNTFPGVATIAGIGDQLICGRSVDATMLTGQNELMGGFWSDIAKKSTGAKRLSIDQSRIQLLQQLLAAELNASAFGSVPQGTTSTFSKFVEWENALCGTNTTAIQKAQREAATFNSQGDSSTFTPGTSADSKNARLWANIPFWDIIKP